MTSGSEIWYNKLFPSHYEFNFDDLQGEFCQTLIKLISTSSNIQEDIEQFSISHDEKCEKLFSLGISSLLSFVQRNWTGPFDESNYFPCLKEQAFQEFTFYEELNENVTHLDLLYLARIIFNHKNLQKQFPISIWWSLRVNMLYESILDEGSTALSQETENLVKSLDNDKILSNDDVNLRSMFHLELAHYYANKKQPLMCEKHTDLALKLMKLDLNLEGAMGKRTRYQQEDKSQLFLSVKLGSEVSLTNVCNNLPKSLALNDDLRLDKIQFSEKKDDVVSGALEESGIITKYLQLYISQPKDNLLKEELDPYLEFLIEKTKNWPLKMSALHQRCKLEAHHKRTIERSMLQMEYLIEQIKSPKTLLKDRLDFFFTSGMKPIWCYKQSLADLMLNLGMVKSSLDIYLNIHLWEEVITCYTILDLKHKAAEIIQQQLAKKTTVKLLCLLGDVTDTEKYYEEAWELSKEKSSRAQRHWGFYYFSKKKYAEAIPHFQKSVELNNIQESVWSRLGFAALSIENWKLAATAYRHYCDLEQGNFEIWNNLAKAYIKLGEKQRAWYCLRDAIKYNYDRWEVWDNLMITSVDLKNFSEVIRCYHRLLDLKGQHVDLEVLEILKIHIVSTFNSTNSNDTEHSTTFHRLLENTLQFFGRLTSVVPNNSDIWLFYGEIAYLKDNERALQHFQRAYRSAVSDLMWHNQTDSAVKVLNLCLILADTCLTCIKNDTEKQKRISMLGSAKLPLQSVIKKIQMEQLYNEELINSMKKVEEKLNIIINELDKTKNDSS